MLHVSLQGEDRFRAIRWVDASPAGTVELATRQSGINYYGVETLNLALGSGDDVFNVQGTLGDDQHRARRRRRARLRLLARRLRPGDRPDYLRGNLDQLHGALNLDAGTGRHLLMISDESALVGDDVASPTRRPAPRS